MDRFPLAKAKAVACYTLDGGKAAEIESECFTAYSVHAEFEGKVIHIGAARGKFANAVAMACHFVSLLPRSESPEATDNWYGYYCPIEIKGSMERSSLDIYLRDFSAEGMERRIAAIKAALRPGGRVPAADRLAALGFSSAADALTALREARITASAGISRSPSRSRSNRWGSSTRTASPKVCRPARSSST
jgi:tripeptide aminopeptidase